MATSSIQKAFILAGGRNTRMGHLAPKALLPVVNRPNVRRVMEKLHDNGVGEFYVASHGGRVLDAAQEGRNPSARSIHPYLEPYPTGTVTATKACAGLFHFSRRDPFFVVAADISHPTMNFRKFAQAFDEARDSYPKLAGAVAFLIRPYDEVIGRYPVAIVNEDNLIERLVERPETPQQAYRIFRQIKARAVIEASEKVGVPCLPVYGSYWLLLQKIFDLVPMPADMKGEDYGRHMFKKMPPEKMFAYFIVEAVRRGLPRVKKEWIDMATPTDFWLANWLFLKTSPQRISGNYNHQDNLRFGRNIVIHPDAEVKDSVLGDNITIEAGCRIANCVIGSNTLLSGVDIRRTIIFGNTHLPRSVGQIEDSILGGYVPLILDKDLSFIRISGKLIVRLPDGKIIVDPLEIRPGESDLAVDCFKKLKFSLASDDNQMDSK